MITLRPFTPGDAPLLHKAGFADHPPEEIAGWIAGWSAGQVNGRAFEMLGIFAEAALVGTISLYQHTHEVVSIGPEIFPPHRRKGYARQALSLACARAAQQGYKIVFQQIRTDNIASIALHTSLGFSTGGQIYTNSHGNPVNIYLKSLV